MQILLHSDAIHRVSKTRPSKRDGGAETRQPTLGSLTTLGVLKEAKVAILVGVKGAETRSRLVEFRTAAALEIVGFVIAARAEARSCEFRELAARDDFMTDTEKQAGQSS